MKLNGADLVLKENEKLKRQNEELQKSEGEVREEAEKEVALVKSEYYRKEQELDQLIEDAEREKQKAKRLTEDTRRQWEIWYRMKRAVVQGYVGVLTMICFVTTVLSVIRQRVFCEDVIGFLRGFGKVIQVFAVRMYSVILSTAGVTERVPNDVVALILKWIMVVLLWLMPIALIGFGVYRFWGKCGEDIRKGIDVWNCSVAVVILAGLVHFGDYVKELVSVNLFGMWLLVDILLVLIGWYVWGCKKHRGLC